MVTFMLNEREMVSLPATEIDIKDGYIIAWEDDKQVAIFRASEVVGCLLETERKIFDGKVY
jgi:hypothetical protein